MPSLPIASSTRPGPCSRGARAALPRTGLSGEAAELLLDVPQRRGGPEVLTDPPEPAVEPVTGMRRVYELLEPAVAERVIFDLGLVRNIGYYTGAVFDVYDPALGAPIGGGRRPPQAPGRLRRRPPAPGLSPPICPPRTPLARA